MWWCDARESAGAASAARPVRDGLGVREGWLARTAGSSGVGDRRALLRAGASIALLSIAALSGCGFHLRGDATLPFKTLYVSTDNHGPFYAELKRAIEGGANVKVLPAAAGAEAILELTPPNPIDEKSILTITGGGAVSEYLLTKRVVFRVHDGKGGEWLPTSTVQARRDYTYNDTQVLAKEAEERLLLQDMQNDVIRGMLRRMQVAARRPGG
jgi:LPS-assembly lipoprotein